MPTREDYPFVGTWGARTSSPTEPGTRSKITTAHRPPPPTAKPLDPARATRAGLASKRAGFGK